MTARTPSGSLRTWLESALVALSTCAALLALSRLIQPGPWLAVACVAVLLLTAAVILDPFFGR